MFPKKGPLRNRDVHRRSSKTHRLLGLEEVSVASAPDSTPHFSLVETSCSFQPIPLLAHLHCKNLSTACHGAALTVKKTCVMEISGHCSLARGAWLKAQVGPACVLREGESG